MVIGKNITRGARNVAGSRHLEDLRIDWRTILKNLNKISWEGAKCCHVAHERSSSRLLLMDFWAP
jgi:hypothetical protein